VSHPAQLSAGVVNAFHALPSGVRLALKPRIDALAEDPRPPGRASLKGVLKGLRKLRAGRYRVCYAVDDRARVVKVVEIGHRRDIYRRAARRR